MGLVAAVLGGAGVSGSAAAAEGLSPEHVALMEFLTNRPPIKEVEFDLSSNRIRIVPELTLRPAFFRVRASLQSGGFFLQFLTGFPFGTNTQGESLDTFWTLTTNTVSLAAKSGPGADPRNGSEILVRSFRRELEALLQFGVEEAEPGSIRWLNPTNFEARTRVLEDGRRLRLTGRLLLDREGRPAELHYQDAERRAVDIHVRYGYEERGAVLPKTVLVRQEKAIFRKHPSQRLMTNVLVRLETGVLASGADGFKPSMFIGEQDPPRELMIHSNGVRYLVTELGMIRNEGVEPPAYALARKGPNLARYVGFGVTVALAGGFVWWLGKRSRQQTDPNQQG